MGARPLVVRELGLQPYAPIYQAMQRFNAARCDDTQDELWLLQHLPVFTLGLNGKSEHLLDPGDIPVVQVDRGGQVTYHGPGQLIVYCLLDLRRRELGVRALVSALENAVIALLADHGVEAYADPSAPGVYVAGRKLASLGLRVRRGGSYHGLSLNVAMDLEPFRRINPCGHRGLEMIQFGDLGIDADLAQTAGDLLAIIANSLGYRPIRPPVVDLPTTERKVHHV